MNTENTETPRRNAETLHRGVFMPTYIVFARYPEEGQVKTRLAPLLGTRGSTLLYRAMVLDILERLAGRGLPTTVCVTPPERVEAFSRLLPSLPNLSFSAQRGHTLGDRMLNAFLDARSDQRLPAIMIGTDSPTLPDAVLDAAEQALGSGSRAVLGPATDGGFYLLGLAEVYADCFFGDDYSNSTVFERTRQALARHCSPALLPEWYDIDDAEGLEHLRAEPRLHEVAPRTAEVLGAGDGRREAGDGK